MRGGIQFSRTSGVSEGDGTEEAPMVPWRELEGGGFGDLID